MVRWSRFLFRWLALVWALPTTSVGLLLLVIAVSTRGRAARVGGVIEVHGGLVGWGLERLPFPRGVAAVTLGHVVLGTSPAALIRSRNHERVHVVQCERWGPLFLPAYAAASLWAWLHGEHPYRDNGFEREAFARSEIPYQGQPPPGVAGLPETPA